ncbi:MAG: DUF3471 domain-containing protein [Gemmatimonadetes bacterium]|nr:DUF3471 domain-containing protein [Gemmatimonadota bacterium]
MLEHNGRQFTWHNGQTGGYYSFIGIDAESGANVLILSNAATNIDDIAVHVLDPSTPVRHPPPPRPTVSVPVEVLERYVGRYQLAPAFSIAITREADELYARATDQPRFRIFAATPTRFFFRAVEAEVEFVASEGGEVTGLILHQGGRSMPGRHVP